MPKRSTPVPPGIAAVIATTERSLAAISMSVSAKTEVYDGGPLGELAWGGGKAGGGERRGEVGRRRPGGGRGGGARARAFFPVATSKRGTPWYLSEACSAGG